MLALAGAAFIAPNDCTRVLTASQRFYTRVLTACHELYGPRQEAQASKALGLSADRVLSAFHASPQEPYRRTSCRFGEIAGQNSRPFGMERPRCTIDQG